ncbi:hypothetical protein BDR04DRAFT_1121904 [Suillus decipiens]|nr:hypothetical protein BDR04DRAFT_1121904 [Suillus decipiens]
MMLSHEEDEDQHPYWYAWIIKVFHINVWYYGPDCDMFMCYRGGGVGHKMPQDLFEHLWSDSAIVENAENEFDFGRLEEEDDEIEEMSCEDEDSEGEDSEGEDSEGEDSEDEDSEDEEDMIIADEGEELDDQYLAQEGFGTL